MEVLFENEYTRNKELAGEFYGYQYFRRPLRIGTFALSAFALALDAYRIIAFDAFPLPTTWLVLAWCILAVIAYFRNTKLMLQRDAEVYGGEVTVRVSYTQECIQAIGPDGASQELKYDNLKSWIDTKHYLLVYSKSKLVLFVRKDGFTKGTLPEFCAFLDGKGIKRRHML